MEIWGKSMLSVHRASAMRPNTRAMVAFVAGELIVRKNFHRIYDYSSGQILNFSVNITEFDVEVIDLSTKEQLAGGAFGKHFSLTHYGEQALVELNIAGRNFDGEHSKGPRFKGFVKDNLVTLKEGANEFVFGLLA
jgi:hypothetical protein